MTRGPRSDATRAKIAASVTAAHARRREAARDVVTSDDWPEPEPEPLPDAVDDDEPTPPRPTPSAQLADASTLWRRTPRHLLGKR